MTMFKTNPTSNIVIYFENKKKHSLRFTSNIYIAKYLHGSSFRNEGTKIVLLGQQDFHKLKVSIYSWL